MLWRGLILATFVGCIYSRYFIVGPAQIRILSVIPCKEFVDVPIQLLLKGHMYNQTTQLLDGFLSLPMGLDDNLLMNLKCARIDKRKTQVNSFEINDSPTCSTLSKYVGNLWTDIQRQIGMEPGVCPIKMGNYSVKNMVLDLTKLNVQMILEGRFRTRVLLKNATKTVYCSDFNIELSPKNH